MRKVDENINEQEQNQPEELLEGTRVAIKHDSGKITYGRIKGKHGSVIEVSHRNGKVGFYHSHKVEQLDEEPSELIQKHLDLGKKQHTDPTPFEKHTAVGHGMSSSNEIHRKMKVNYQKGE